MMYVDILKLLSFSLSPAELLLRGTLMYWLLFLLLRFVLRRDASSVGVGDILFIVLLGDAAQNSMIGAGSTVSDGVVLIATLAFWNFATDFVAFRFPATRPLLQPRRLTLFENGRRIRKNLRREFITDDELNEEVRLQGLSDLSEVQAIYLEAGGDISVVKKKA
jgi:uncharacterized membrane protein YcaP (DUF421 family)